MVSWLYLTMSNPNASDGKAAHLISMEWAKSRRVIEKARKTKRKRERGPKKAGKNQTERKFGPIRKLDG